MPHVIIVDLKKKHIHIIIHIASFSLTIILYGILKRNLVNTLFYFTINPINSLQDHSATIHSATILIIRNENNRL